MGNVIFDMSMSLDGFIAGANNTPEEPLGPGGQVLQDWLTTDREAYERALSGTDTSIGAVIMGRRTYDHSVEWWAGKGPVGEVPCFVVSHTVPEKVGPVFTFVTDGIESALAKARTISGDKNIGLMGANLQQQYIRAGLVDMMYLNIVPVLFGAGTRLFEHLGDEKIKLERVSEIELPSVTHLAFRVVKGK